MEVGEAVKQKEKRPQVEEVMASLPAEKREVIEAEFKRLREKAGYDDLLEEEGVLNRRGLAKEARRELARLERGELQELVVVMWDVDLFKLINDQFGHGYGDQLLKDVAGSIQKKAREGDLLARTGGDELVLLMPVSSVREGFGENGLRLEERLEEIGKEMEERIRTKEKLLPEGVKWPKKVGRKAGRISYGVKRWDWQKVEDQLGEEGGRKLGDQKLYEELIKKADQRLGEVKRGR